MRVRVLQPEGIAAIMSPLDALLIGLFLFAAALALGILRCRGRSGSNLTPLQAASAHSVMESAEVHPTAAAGILAAAGTAFMILAAVIS